MQVGFFVVCTAIESLNGMFFYPDEGRQVNFDAANILIAALQAWRVTESKERQSVIASLVMALEVFESSPSYAVSNVEKLWSALESEFPEHWLSCRKFMRVFGEATLRLCWIHNISYQCCSHSQAYLDVFLRS